MKGIITVDNLRSDITPVEYWLMAGKIRAMSILVYDGRSWYTVMYVLDDTESEAYFVHSGQVCRDWPKHWQWARLQ